MQFVDTTNYSLPSQKDAQNQVFGDYTTRDASDYSQAAYNYLIHQQDNALQIALMNYQNRYNSPENQMLLRQAAGINPYSDYSVQGAAASSVGSSPQVRSSGNYAKHLQATQSLVGQLLNSFEVGQKLYDYITYGRDLSKYQVDAAVGRSNVISENVQQEVMKTGQLAWMLGYPGYDQIGESPFGSQFNATTGTKYAAIRRTNAYLDQVKYMIEHLYPSQVERNEALKALDDYRLEMLKGQYGAAVNLNTGNSTADSIIQFLLFMLRDNLRFGFTGRMF